jgi:hypothetical protein
MAIAMGFLFLEGFMDNGSWFIAKYLFDGFFEINI